MSTGAKLAVASLIVAAAGCTSDVSGDGAGPDLGHSTLLASLRSGVQLQALAVDGDAVYWSDGDALYRCAKNGCNMQPTTLASVPFDANAPRSATPFAGLSSLSVGGGYAFWAAGESQTRRIYACATAGCPKGPEPLAEVSSNGTVVDLQADGSGVYWATGTGPTTSILSCPGTACGPWPKTIAQVGTSGPQLTFALAGGRVYFWNQGSGNNGGTGAPASLPTGLVSCPESGCTTDVRVHFAVAAQPGPGSTQSSVVAADEGAVYLATPSSTTSGTALTRCVLPTCAALDTLASASGAGPLVNASNGAATRVYQTADALYAQITQCSGNCNDAPSLVMCAKSGCPQGVTTLRSDPSFPIASSGPSNNSGNGNVTVAVDPSGIYWAAAPAYYDAARFLLRSPLK